MQSVVRFVLASFVLTLVNGSFLQAQNSEASSINCPAEPVTLNVAAGAVGQDLELTQKILDRYMEYCPNATLHALQPPDLANNRFEYYSVTLGMGDSDIDVYQLDATWPGLLAEHFVNFYDYVAPDSPQIQQHFPQTIENNTVNGRLVALPWFTDVGLLYYRTDLLEKYGLDVPSTWDELETAASIIQEGERSEGNSQFWGYVWPGGPGETMTTTALEWQASQGGGTIITLDGEVQVNNPETVLAMQRAADWIDTITPSAVLGQGTEVSLPIWQSGNAAFMRNWTFAYSLSNNPDVSLVAGKFGVTQLPGVREELRTGVLGGWQLAVSRYSRNPEAAVSLALFMTSPEAQKLRAVEGGLLPTIATLYDDPDIIEAQPLISSMLEIVAVAVPRPSTVSGDQYDEVSRLYSNAVGQILQGSLGAEEALQALESDLNDLVEVEGIGTARRD
jgi:trehalose/maltose transport system substrate-binding protein